MRLNAGLWSVVAEALEQAGTMRPSGFTHELLLLCQRSRTDRGATS